LNLDDESTSEKERDNENNETENGTLQVASSQRGQKKNLLQQLELTRQLPLEAVYSSEELSSSDASLIVSRF
jgi:hypothetical protein